MDLVLHFHGNIIVAPDPDLRQQIAAEFKKLHEKVDRLKMLAEETKAIVQEIDAETNKVAERVDTQLKALRDQIAAGNGDTAALQAIHDSLAAIPVRLRAIASDPANPVPVDPNPPVPTT